MWILMVTLVQQIKLLDKQPLMIIDLTAKHTSGTNPKRVPHYPKSFTKHGEQMARRLLHDLQQRESPSSHLLIAILCACHYNKLKGGTVWHTVLLVGCLAGLDPQTAQQCHIVFRRLLRHCS